MDDMALLREYAARNSEAAFAELVSRRVGFVYSAALRQVGDPHFAEEVTQAVFILLAQKAGRLRDGTILSGWLFRTTRFVALAHMRSAAQRRQREQETHMQTEREPATPDPLWEQFSPRLDEALAALGETDRQAVLLRFFENKSLLEVGNRLGTGEDTARKRVSRALEKLRRYFSRRGVISTTAIIAGALSANSVHAAPAMLANSATSLAIGKGATAAASTLSLIKGALKLIAWAKAKMALAGATVLLVAGAGTAIVKDYVASREPAYQGRRLLDWLADADYGQPEERRTKAAEAIRQMGSKTLPFLLADLGERRPDRVNYSRPDTRTPDQRYRQACWAFDALGPIAKPAIPELTRLLEKNPGYAPLALAHIGGDALPEVLNALTNGSFFVRDNTAAGLADAIYSGKITPAEAISAFPIAIRNLTYTDTNALFQENTRWRAVSLVDALQLNPEISVPALMQLMEDTTNTSLAAQCAFALGDFGKHARPAIPALNKAARSTNADLSRAATQSLKRIATAR